jgi:hypothetical protein
LFVYIGGQQNEHEVKAMATTIKVHAQTITAAAAMAAAALIAVAPTASAATQTPGQQVGDALRSGITALEQPLVPYIETYFGYPMTGPDPGVPTVTNSSISLLIGGTTYPVISAALGGQLAAAWHLTQPYALYTPEQFFPATPSLGSLSLDQSVAQGADLLTAALLTELKQGNSVTVWTTSQSSTVASEALRLLAAQNNPGVGQLSFILTGDPNNPNGGPFERFPGLYIPVAGITFSGATPPDTPYDVAIYSNQYDGVADFPQYPLNVVSDLNALAGFAFGQHYYGMQRPYIQLPTSPGYTGTTTYYKALDPTLPLLVPVRQYIPAPYGNALADLAQPDLRVIVDMGYGSGEYANIPTPASLFELPDPFTIARDLVTGTIQGPQAALVDLGVLPASATPTGYPATPVLDPHLNYPLPQSSTTGLSLLTTTEGNLHTGSARIASVINTAISSVTTQGHTAVTGATKPGTAAVSKPNAPVRTAISSVSTRVRTALTDGSKRLAAAFSKPTNRAAATGTTGHDKKP